MRFGLKHTLREVVVVLIANITLRRGVIWGLALFFFEKFPCPLSQISNHTSPQGDVCTKIITAGAVKHQKTTKQRENNPSEIWLQVEMRNTVEKHVKNEMRIERGTKWGLGGWDECRTAAALGESGTSVLVSERPKICMNSISTHSALGIAKWLR